MRLLNQLMQANTPPTPPPPEEKRIWTRKVFYTQGPKTRPGEAKYRAAMGSKWMTVPEIAKAVGYTRAAIETSLRRYVREGRIERRLSEKRGLNNRRVIEWRWK